MPPGQSRLAAIAAVVRTFDARQVQHVRESCSEVFGALQRTEEVDPLDTVIGLVRAEGINYVEHLRSEHDERKKRRLREGAPAEETKGVLSFVDMDGNLDIPSNQEQRQARQELMPTLSALLIRALPSVARSDEIRVAKTAKEAGKSVMKRSYAKDEPNVKLSGTALEQHVDELQEPLRARSTR